MMKMYLSPSLYERSRDESQPQQGTEGRQEEGAAQYEREAQTEEGEETPADFDHADQTFLVKYRPPERPAGFLFESWERGVISRATLRFAIFLGGLILQAILFNILP